MSNEVVKTYSTQAQRDRLAMVVTPVDETLARVVTDANVLHELIAAGRILPEPPSSGAKAEPL